MLYLRLFMTKKIYNSFGEKMYDITPQKSGRKGKNQKTATSAKMTQVKKDPNKYAPERNKLKGKAYKRSNKQLKVNDNS